MEILLAANSKYFLQTSALIYSIFENNPGTHICVHLFYSDISPAELARLEQLAAHFGGRLLSYYCSNERISGLVTTALYPYEIYYRLLAIDMLPKELKTILYLDVDMIVKGSLLELYDTNLDGYAFAACNDIYSELSTSQPDALILLGIPSDFKYINSGMLLLNLDYLREHHAAADLLAYIQNSSKSNGLPDQDALNKLFFSNIKYVPYERYNCPPMLYYREPDSGLLVSYPVMAAYRQSQKPFPPEWDNAIAEYYNHAVIVHFAGTRKPWLEYISDLEAVQVFAACYYEYANKAVDFYTGVSSSTH